MGTDNDTKIVKTATNILQNDHSGVKQILKGRYIFYTH